MKRQHDNSTYKEKVKLRKEALKRLGIDQPAVMETHGGMGVLFDACYAHIERCVVFEKQTDKVDRLALQRPTWAVYEANCETALQTGAGAHLTIDLLDVDPYGECWPVIEAFFGSSRPFADRMIAVVNDGLRQSLSMGKAWSVGSLRGVVEKFGNDLHPVYLDVCHYLMKEKAALAGYEVEHFGGYYCGIHKANTHFMAVLKRC